MKLLEGEYNSTSPPSHNDTVEYVCDAGPDWNRFASNFSRWSLTLTCLPDNQWSSVEWPTCLNGLCRYNIRHLLIYEFIFSDQTCRDPNPLVTNEIVLYEAITGDLSYGEYAR